MALTGALGRDVNQRFRETDGIRGVNTERGLPSAFARRAGRRVSAHVCLARLVDETQGGGFPTHGPGPSQTGAQDCCDDGRKVAIRLRDRA